MRKKTILFTLAALTILSLSGCHKDKAEPTEPAPLETIKPDVKDETISDKLDEAPTLSIEEAPETLSDDAISIQFDIETSETDSSTNVSESKSENESEIASSELKASESESESLADTKETISESEAQAILESEVAVRESAQDSASDWVKQNQEMESMANDYYSKQLEEQMADKELMDSLNPYK